MPADLSVAQFVYVIRKRIKLSPEKAIFVFVDNVLPPSSSLMSAVYAEHKDEDGYSLIDLGKFIADLGTYRINLGSCILSTLQKTLSGTESRNLRLNR